MTKKVAKRGATLTEAAQEVYQSWTTFPDWRDQSAYPSPKAGDALQWWGLEFIRRQREFQHRLLAQLERLSPVKQNQLKPRVHPGWSGWTLPSSIWRNLVPVWPHTRSWPRFSDSEEVHRAPVGYVHLTFNLRHPIDEQLLSAKRVLKNWQTSQIEAGVIPPIKDKRVSRELLPHYLRLLDAEAEGATLKQIADHLSKELPGGIGTDTIPKSLKAARRYRDRDYVLLLQLIGDRLMGRPTRRHHGRLPRGECRPHRENTA